MNTQRGAILKLILLAMVVAPTAAIADRSDVDNQLRQIISDIEYGWENADGAPFYRHFLGQDSARFIESGGQNKGLKDLVEHHVEPEGDVLDSLDLVFSKIETHVQGNFAWAIANVEVKATVKKDNRQIHNRGFETFLFRHGDDGWKVIHTHSSTRPVR